MQRLTFANPIFVAYAIASALLLLKAVAMSWLTVVRMMQVKGGFRAPEDLRKSALNPTPDPRQLAPDERVDRFRRIQQNDLENLPFFFVAGLLYLFTDPPPVLAQSLLYGYALSRLLHFAAYATAQSHEIRATFWTIGSLIIVFMSVVVLMRGIAAL